MATGAGRSGVIFRARQATAPGVESARLVIETCARLDIPALTLYAFSMENWRGREPKPIF